MLEKVIDGFGGLYTVTSCGKVKRGGKLLKGGLGTNGYRGVSLCYQGKPKRREVHRLVAIAFIPNPDSKREVNHKNGDKLDNRVENLEWATSKENKIHSINVLGKKNPGTYRGKFGSEHNRSKSFEMISPDGEIIKFGSGLEAGRKIGIDHSSISYARKHFTLPHKFKRGKLKGWTLNESD